jgi:hypothetical protein
MPAQLTQLVDKLDTFEIVRDKIGEILVVEEAAQRALAEADEKDPQLWALKIYSERADPWSDFVDPEAEDEQSTAVRSSKTPIVNVWFDNTQIDFKGSNLIDRQKYVGIFNVDCYGYGCSTGTEDGHAPGDAKSAGEAQRAARLVRNILMSSFYMYLDLRGVVGRRWVQGIQTFPAKSDGESVQNVAGARVALHVEFNELSPQFEGELLEMISVDVTRRSDGLLYLTANFPQEL